MKIDLLKLSKWISTWTAAATMVISPVAMGKEVETSSMQRMQTLMQVTGLNQSMTFGEFYAKNKDMYPPRIQKIIEPLAIKFKNTRMPQVELVSSKATDGTEIPTLRVSDNGQLFNLQYFGEDEKFLKFQNTNLTKVDVINFDDMVVKVLAGDEKMRKGLDPKWAPIKYAPSNRGFNFAKYPDMNERDWNQMSDFDRAAYIVNMRLLWLDAQKVISAKAKTSGKQKKTSKNYFDKNEKFFEMLFGSDAVAGAPKSSSSRAAKPATRAQAEARPAATTSDDRTCIVAGYVARYNKKEYGEVCDHNLIADRYKTAEEKSLYNMAAKFCAADDNQMACNPAVFGAPGGRPTCVKPGLDQAFQKVTSFEGLCDSKSRLQSAQNPIQVVDKDIKEGRYEGANLISNEEREKASKVAETANNFKLTEDYLLGVLKFRKTLSADATTIFKDGIIGKEVLAVILADKQAFDAEIKYATDSCKMESANKKVSHETNYWKACDQLQRRYLHVEGLLASKCGMKSKFLTSSMMCECGETNAKQLVLPGANCGAPIAQAPPATNPAPIAQNPPVKESREDCSKYGSIELDAKCKCPSGKPPFLKLRGPNKEERYSCGMQSEDSEDTEKITKKEPCGFMCSFSKNLLPIGVTLVASALLVFGMKKLFEFKPRANPGDGCPNGAPAPCTPSCTKENGVCVTCARCPIGQGQASSDSCTCSTIAKDPPINNTFLCPDSKTMVTNINDCPLYECTTTVPPIKVQKPSNCPMVAPSNAPNTNPSVNRSR